MSMMDRGLMALTGTVPESFNTGAVEPPVVKPWMVAAGAVAGVVGIAAIANSAMERAVKIVNSLPRLRETDPSYTTFDAETMSTFLDSLPEDDRETYIDPRKKGSSSRGRYAGRENRLLDGNYVLNRAEWTDEQREQFAEWVAESGHPKANLYAKQYHHDPYMNLNDVTSKSAEIAVFNADLKPEKIGRDAGPVARAMLNAYGYKGEELVPGQLILGKNVDRDCTGTFPPEPKMRWSTKKAGMRRGHTLQYRRWMDQPHVRLVLMSAAEGPGMFNDRRFYDDAWGTATLTACAGIHPKVKHVLPRRSGSHSKGGVSDVFVMQGHQRASLDDAGFPLEEAYDSPSFER
jgi:hypothetical protein